MELGIEVSLTPNKKKNPTTKAGKRKDNKNAILRHNREWTGVSKATIYRAIKHKNVANNK